MKRYFMTFGFVTVLAAASVPAMGEETPADITVDGATYQPVEVNGQHYYLKDSGKGGRTKRSADASSAGPALYSGDVLRRNSVEPEQKISGSILIKASEPEAQEIAQRHGLQIGRQVGSIARLKASGSTDVNQLATRLRQEGHEVEIEVYGPLNRPN